MKQEKLKYTKPQIEVVQLEIEDILTISKNYNDIPEEPGIDLPIDQF